MVQLIAMCIEMEAPTRDSDCLPSQDSLDELEITTTDEEIIATIEYNEDIQKSICLNVPCYVALYERNLYKAYEDKLAKRSPKILEIDEKKRYKLVTKKLLRKFQIHYETYLKWEQVYEEHRYSDWCRRKMWTYMQSVLVENKMLDENHTQGVRSQTETYSGFARNLEDVAAIQSTQENYNINIPNFRLD